MPLSQVNKLESCVLNVKHNQIIIGSVVASTEKEDITLQLYDQPKIPSPPPKSPVAMTPCPAYQTVHCK